MRKSYGVITIIENLHKYILLKLLSRSAHRTPNFTNPEFQFLQLKELQSVSFSFQYKELYWHFGVYFDINLKLLSGKNTQKANKQKIRDSLNWVLDELNEIYILIQMFSLFV